MADAPVAAGEPVKAGDVVRLDYELWAEGAGKTELVDTTRKEAAEKASWNGRPAGELHPMAHVIGREYFPAAIEKALAALRVGESLDREFPAAEAFGERDPKLIETFPMSRISRLPEMRREDAHLDIGTILTIDGRQGRVVTLTAGRVKVDFNNPLAGRKVRAQITITEKLSRPEDLVTSVLEMDYGHAGEFQVSVTPDTVTIRLPDRAKFDVQWMAQKSRVVEDLRQIVKPARILFEEEFKTPAPKAEPAPPSQKAGETPAGGTEPPTTG